MADRVMVDVTRLSAELHSQLDAFGDGVKKDIEQAVDESAEELKNKLRKSSPKRSRKQPYAAQWKVDDTTRALVHSKTVHNAKKYRLTHLLEKGTKDRTTKRGWHRGAGPVRVHIKPPTDETLEKFEERCVEIIKQHGGI